MRAVRPTRCTNADGSCGASCCTIQCTSGMSSPRAATSVQKSAPGAEQGVHCGQARLSGIAQSALPLGHIIQTIETSHTAPLGKRRHAPQAATMPDLSHCDSPCKVRFRHV